MSAPTLRFLQLSGVLACGALTLLGCGTRPSCPVAGITTNGVRVIVDNELGDDARKVTIDIDGCEAWRGDIPARKQQSFVVQLDERVTHPIGAQATMGTHRLDIRATIPPGRAVVPVVFRGDDGTASYIGRNPDDIPPCHGVPAAGPFVQHQIRLSDRTSKAFALNAVALRVDGKELFPATQEAAIVAAVRAEQSPTWTTSLRAGCHEASLALTLVGKGLPMAGYKFEVTTSHAFQASVSGLLEVEVYEPPAAPMSERPAVRFLDRHVAP